MNCKCHEISDYLQMNMLSAEWEYKLGIHCYGKYTGILHESEMHDEYKCKPFLKSHDLTSYSAFQRMQKRLVRGCHFNGQITFDVECVADIRRPHKGDQFVCTFLNINKMGLLAKAGDDGAVLERYMLKQKLLFGRWIGNQSVFVSS